MHSPLQPDKACAEENGLVKLQRAMAGRVDSFEVFECLFIPAFLQRLFFQLSTACRSRVAAYQKSTPTGGLQAFFVWTPMTVTMKAQVRVYASQIRNAQA
jgi:hypothetical protein